MPLPKEEFDQLHPCAFYEPDELLDPDQMYTVEEVARLLQGREPEESLDPETETVLVDWAIPWIVDNADELVVAEPRHDADPGRYGLSTDPAGGEES